MPRKKVKILGLAGSIRSRNKDIVELKTLVVESTSLDELKQKISSTGIVYANSDIALAIALYSAHEHGADIDFLSIKSLFSNIDQPQQGFEGLIDHTQVVTERVDDMLERLQAADGVIFSTPVYFGDRSSIANKFMQITSRTKALENKVFGAIAVGAKRNGGQETTCIYSLIEGLAQNCFGVGNGPNTAQYGGTVVACDPRDALNDNAGLTRCYELGRKATQTAKIVSAGMEASEFSKLKAKVLMTMDSPDKRFRGYVERLFEPALDKDEIDLEIVDLIDYPIARCIACNSCPAGGKSQSYDKLKCVFHNEKDCLFEVFPIMADADVLFIAGVNTNEDIVYRYQAFTERTRCIRRDNYKLSNMPMAGILINDPSASNSTLHNMKVITSYIRHNTIFLNQLQVIHMDGNVLYQSDIGKTIRQAQIVKKGREITPPIPMSYQADGYADTSQDEIVSVRS